MWKQGCRQNRLTTPYVFQGGEVCPYWNYCHEDSEYDKFVKDGAVARSVSLVIRFKDLTEK
jgi:hypothetical protein